MKGLRGVVEHGHYEAMDEELLMLKGSENALKDVKFNRKLSRDDIEDLDTVTREYLAFLLTNQWFFHEGEESLSMASKALDSVEKRQKLEPQTRQHLKTLIDSYAESLQIAQRMHGANEPESQKNLDLVQSFIEECVDQKADPEPTLKILRDYVATLNEMCTPLKEETPGNKRSRSFGPSFPTSQKGNLTMPRSLTSSGNTSIPAAEP